MKRNRVISLMLALAMILTFMPAMAFADSDNTGSARTGTIKEPQITDNGQKIPAEAQAKSLAAQGFIIVANLPETTATEWSVKSRWLMEDYKSEIDLYATLDGIKADNDTIYQWYLQKGNEWVELDENDSEFEVYKNNCCFTLLEDTNLKCAVTIDGLTSVGSFSVFIDTTDYEVETYNPGATATYTQKYGRALKVNYIYNSENFPNDGDTITINNNGEEEVYTCYFNIK